MPNNVYSEIHLHITWHVKTGAVIEPGFEAKLHGFIRDYAARMQGVIVHAVGGITDHIHLASPYRRSSTSANGSEGSKAPAPTTSTNI